MMPIAHVMHALQGRVRIRIPSRRGNKQYFSRLHASLVTFSAVENLRINPKTGSVLIEYTGASFVQLKSFAIETELFLLEDLENEPRAVWQRATSGFEEIDSKLRKLTGGEIDLRSVLFIGLVMMGIRQLSRGYVMGPAMTIFWQALGLILTTRDSKK